MAKRPVLVIHGVANRDKKKFDENVAALADGIGRDRWDFIGAYWGDIGAPVAGITDAVPSPETSWQLRDGEWVPPVSPEVADFAAEPVPTAAQPVMSLLEQQSAGRLMFDTPTWTMADLLDSSADPVDRIAKAAMQRLGPLATPIDEAELRQRIGDALAVRPSLRSALDADGQARLGVAIARSVAAGAAAAARSSTEVAAFTSPIDWLGDAVDEAFDLVSGILDGVADRVGGWLNQLGRDVVLDAFGTGIGDVLYYQANQAAIQRRVRQKLDEGAPGWGREGKPVAILGHSLGGIIAWDMAILKSDPIFVDPLVTFGSQSAIVEIFSPRRASRLPGEYRPGVPIELPPTIRRWTNFWESLDPLAFSAARVFRTPSPDQVRDLQLRYRTDKPLFTHDTYWRDPDLHAEVRRLLEATLGAG